MILLPQDSYSLSGFGCVLQPIMKQLLHRNNFLGCAVNKELDL